MDRVLLVTQSPRRKEQFTRLVTELLPADICYAGTCGEAWRMISENTFALVLILAPLPDEFGVHLAREAAQTTAGVILVGKGYQLDEVRHKLEADGIFAFGAEMGRIMFGYAVSLMLSVHRRLARAAPQTERLQEQIRDIRTVDRAKCLLIQYAGMTEQEAHTFIEKLAMDHRLTRRMAAQKILDKYQE